MSSEKVICRMAHGGVALHVPQFDLGQIADSGQCFRLMPLDDGGYLAVTGRKFVKISQDSTGGYVFHCSFSDFRDVWLPYFDLETDYEVYQKKMAEDPFLLEAIKTGGGIRILRQDLWEAVITFVISQRNNIPRIRSAVETLCREFGERLGEVGGIPVYSFPTAEQLRGKDLSCARLGYREKYIKELCNLQPGFWERVQQQQDDAEAYKILLNLGGIGEKVANCIMLYGLHRMNRYPKDVWINRMIEDVYHGDFDPAKYAGFAGYVQQLQFYYYRLITKGVEV